MIDNIHLAKQMATAICYTINEELSLNGHVYGKPILPQNTVYTATIRGVKFFERLNRFTIILEVSCLNFDYVLILIKYSSDTRKTDSFSGNLANPDSIESIKNLIAQHIDISRDP